MNALRYLVKPKLFVGLVAAAVVGIVGLGMVQNGVFALPEDCDPNAIIKCGFQDKPGFKSDYNANVYGDIHTIYADPRFNFTSDEMDRFMSTAKWATAYKDGRIVLDDGRVVATNSWSIGRQGGSANPHTTTINGKTYYWGYNSTAFQSNSIRTLVMMDKQDKYMEFAVITSCGNPITGTKPKFQCDMLHTNKITETKREFWTDITAKDGATIKSVVYSFGDGTFETRKDGSKFTHEFKKPGNYHVEVKVIYNVNGKETVEEVQAKCQTDITVEEEVKPAFVCQSLTFVRQGTSRRFTFTVVGSSNKAKFISAKVDFGDGSSATDLKENVPGKPETVTVDHEYKENKEFVAKAFITYDKGTTPETANCIVKVPVTTETCVENKELPGCKILPSTGPTEMIVSALGLSSITGAGLYYIGTRRNLFNSFLNR